MPSATAAPIPARTGGRDRGPPDRGPGRGLAPAAEMSPEDLAQDAAGWSIALLNGQADCLRVGLEAGKLFRLEHLAPHLTLPLEQHLDCEPAVFQIDDGHGHIEVPEFVLAIFPEDTVGIGVAGVQW